MFFVALGIIILLFAYAAYSAQKKITKLRQTINKLNPSFSITYNYDDNLAIDEKHSLIFVNNRYGSEMQGVFSVSKIKSYGFIVQRKAKNQTVNSHDTTPIKATTNGIIGIYINFIGYDTSYSLQMPDSTAKEIIKRLNILKQ